MLFRKILFLDFWESERILVGNTFGIDCKVDGSSIGVQ